MEEYVTNMSRKFLEGLDIGPPPSGIVEKLRCLLISEYSKGYLAGWDTKGRALKSLREETDKVIVRMNARMKTDIKEMLK